MRYLSASHSKDKTIVDKKKIDRVHISKKFLSKFRVQNIQIFLHQDKLVWYAFNFHSMANNKDLTHVACSLKFKVKDIEKIIYIDWFEIIYSFLNS